MKSQKNEIRDSFHRYKDKWYTLSIEQEIQIKEIVRAIDYRTWDGFLCGICENVFLQGHEDIEKMK